MRNVQFSGVMFVSDMSVTRSAEFLVYVLSVLDKHVVISGDRSSDYAKLSRDISSNIQKISQNGK